MCEDITNMNNSTENKTQYNLWNVLKEKNVVIPSIQRDYAQGRVFETETIIRSNFLKGISDSIKYGNPKYLDYVYGREEAALNPQDNPVFEILDGQQRLTTLWLVHWFVALNAGKLGEKEANRDKDTGKYISDILKRFSYATRVSSIDFCNAICEKLSQYDTAKNIDGLVEYIKNQMWFKTNWLQDPTVSSMLVVIGGSGNRKDDCLIDLFNDFKANDWEKAWDYLSNDDVTKSIYFEWLNIKAEKLPKADDLYVKLNGRGKRLSDFENFKSDFVKEYKLDFEKKRTIDIKINRHKLRDVKPNNKTRIKGVSDDIKSRFKRKKEFLEYIDVDLSEFFFEYAKNCLECANEEAKAADKTGLREDKKFDGNIDALLFQFMNIFFLNQVCLKKDDSNEYLLTGDHYKKNRRQFESDDKLSASSDVLANYKQFDVLYGRYYSSRNDSAQDYRIRYREKSVYECYWREDIIVLLDKVMRNLKEYGFDKDTLKRDVFKTNGILSFMPTRRFNKWKDGFGNTLQSKNTTQNARLLFAAFCGYVKCHDLLSDDQLPNFKRWMQVATNIILFADIDTIQDMVSGIRMFMELADKLTENNGDNWNVDEALSKLLDLPDSIFWDDLEGNPKQKSQLREEMEKAKIRNEGYFADSWDEFEETEKEFKGTVRFLYRDANGDIDADFEHFIAKRKKLKENRLTKEDWIKKHIDSKYKSKGDEEIHYYMTIDFLRALLIEFNRNNDVSPEDDLGFARIRKLSIVTVVWRERRGSNWFYNVLCSDNKDVQRAVHNLLLDKTHGGSSSFYYQLIGKSNFLEKLFCDAKKKKINLAYSYNDDKGEAGFYANRNNEYSYIVSENRREFNNALVELVHKSNIPDECLEVNFKGKDSSGVECDFTDYYFNGNKITFQYNGKEYEWTSAKTKKASDDSSFNDYKYLINEEEWTTPNDLTIVLNKLEST